MLNREAIVEAPADDRGGRAKVAPRKALTLAEYLYRKDILTLEEFSAAGQLRNLHLLLIPPSEGVSSYGLSTGRADPIRKGDRKAGRLTGVEIQLNGKVGPFKGALANDTTERRYRDALFAMAGVTTEDGDRVVDSQVVHLMLRAVIDDEDLPTQLQIGQARAVHKSEKQLSASGATFVKEHLRRLALHFRISKGDRWR